MQHAGLTNRPARGRALLRGGPRALALLLGLAAAAPASAVRVVPVDNLPCPFDPSARVRGFRMVLDNRVGGWDADTATYAKEGQWRSFRVATCEGSLFSVYQEDLSIQLDARQRRAVEQALTLAKAKLVDPAKPTVTERHQLALAVYAALGRPPLQLADGYLEASWTARDRAVGETMLLEGPAFTRRLLDMGLLELQKPLSPAQQRSVRFNLARVAHRGGYAAERDAHLAAFEALGPLSEEEALAVQILREAAVRLEPSLQREALRYYEIALKRGDLGPADAARARYLSAELRRRLGERGPALQGLRAAAADPALEPRLREMAAALAAELSGDSVGAGQAAQ